MREKSGISMGILKWMISGNPVLCHQWCKLSSSFLVLLCFMTMYGQAVGFLLGCE